MKRTMFVLVALFAVLNVFQSVAQCDDSNDRLFFRRGEVELFEVPGGSDKTRLHIGSERSPLFSMVVRMSSAPIEFLFPGTLGFVSEEKDFPTDPSKLHFLLGTQHERNFIRMQEPGKCFTLQFLDGKNKPTGKYLSVKVSEFVEDALQKNRYLYREEKYKDREGKIKTRMVKTDEPAPPKLKSIKLAWRWWPRCTSIDYGLAFPSDSSKRQYKVPIGEEIPLGRLFLLFGEDAKGTFVTVRKYGPGQGSTFACTTPLDIEKIKSPWSAMYEHSHDATSKYDKVDEVRAPLVFGEGRQYKVNDDFVAIKPLSRDGSNIVFDMRLWMTKYSRELLAKQHTVEEPSDDASETKMVNVSIERKITPVPEVTTPRKEVADTRPSAMFGETYVFKGFAFKWTTNQEGLIILEYEGVAPSIRKVDYGITAGARLEDVNLAKTIFMECDDRSKPSKGAVPIGPKQFLILRVNDRFYLGMTMVELENEEIGPAKILRPKKAVYEGYLWPTITTVARADASAAR